MQSPDMVAYLIRNAIVLSIGISIWIGLWVAMP
jgi:hypothetical protein